MIKKIIRILRGFFTPDLVFEKLTDSAVLPSRSSEESAGLDLYSITDTTIPAGHTVKIPLGIRASFNPGWAACIWDRSGLGSKGYHRYAGLIDSDYRGQWQVVIHNATSEFVNIFRGDRVAQVVIQRVWIGTPKEGKVDTSVDRGGGFGSTGR